MRWSSPRRCGAAAAALGCAVVLSAAPVRSAEPEGGAPGLSAEAGDPFAFRAGPDECAPSVRERAERIARGLLDGLARRERTLARREAALARRRAGESAAAREAARLLDELRLLREEVEARLDDLARARDARADALARLYGRMPPDRAAALLRELPPVQAVRVLLAMQAGRAAEVLAELPPAEGAALSRRLAAPLARADAR